jgi:hypothetical protein
MHAIVVLVGIEVLRKDNQTTGKPRRGKDECIVIVDLVSAGQFKGKVHMGDGHWMHFVAFPELDPGDGFLVSQRRRTVRAGDCTIELAQHLSRQAHVGATSQHQRGSRLVRVWSASFDGVDENVCV